MRGYWDGRLLIVRMRGWRWKMTRRRVNGRLSICGERGWSNGRLLICRVRGWRWKMTRRRMDGRLSICGERGWSNGRLFVVITAREGGRW